MRTFYIASLLCLLVLGSAQVWFVCIWDHTVLPATHTRLSSRNAGPYLKIYLRNIQPAVTHLFTNCYQFTDPDGMDGLVDRLPQDSNLGHLTRIEPEARALTIRPRRQTESLALA